MSNLLYCANGVVLAWHDSSQNVPASAYGPGVTIIPWSLPMGALSRVGSPPPAGSFDSRPYVAPTISGASQLVAYASTKQSLIMNGGVSVNVGTQQSPQMVECATNADGRSLLTGAVNYVATNPSVNWINSTGPITLTAAQVNAMNTAVTAFIQATFTTLGQVLAAITGGTITTQAQVDTPPTPIPAWPVNS